MLAITVLGLKQHLLVLLHHIDDVQLDAQLLGHPKGIVALRIGAAALADGMGVALHAEAGEEVDAFHMNALLHDHFGGEHGVQPAGNEGNGFDLSGHGICSSGGPRSLGRQRGQRNLLHKKSGLTGYGAGRRWELGQRLGLREDAPRRRRWHKFGTMIGQP